MFALAKRFDDECEVEEAEEEGIKFVEAGEDSAEALSRRKKSLDFVALLVESAGSYSQAVVRWLTLGGTTRSYLCWSTSCSVSSPS